MCNQHSKVENISLTKFSLERRQLILNQWVNCRDWNCPLTSITRTVERFCCGPGKATSRNLSYRIQEISRPKNLLTITEHLLAMTNSRNLRIPNTQLVALVRHLTCFGRRGPEPQAPVRS